MNPSSRKVTFESLRITATAAKVYIAMVLNLIRLEIEKILRKNQDGF